MTTPKTIFARVYDVAVIGAGPAGLIAAGKAASSGATVVLLEKNDRAGKKLLLTGKERCNLTSGEENMLKFAEAFGKKGKFLLSALAHFGTSDAIRFFNDLGIPTKVEKGAKVFPVSDKAQDVCRSLLHYVEKHNVSSIFCSTVREIIQTESGFKLMTQEETFLCSSVIISTGGLSYTSLGSSGDGYTRARNLG
ncbi:MAG: NAD(P)/FAD-dependent oxidoreductase, partial [Candidatus Margulisiibacteriota bacterium]